MTPHKRHIGYTILVRRRPTPKRENTTGDDSTQPTQIERVGTTEGSHRQLKILPPRVLCRVTVSGFPVDPHTVFVSTSFFL